MVQTKTDTLHVHSQILICKMCNIKHLMQENLSILELTNHLGGLLRGLLQQKKMFHCHLQEAQFYHIYFNFLDIFNLEFILIKTKSFTMFIHNILLRSLARGQ